MGAVESPAKIWMTALYCRLSREDGDRAESDSIGNQRLMLEEYVYSRPELSVYDVYIDDGYTGTNFDRPSFCRMMQDIEKGHISCVLVKDLSRFGRDYIDAGRYLERWLPEHGVRFIAVADQIDSARGAYDMLMPLKNLFNAQYAKDISQKVKSALSVKQQRGDFIGAFASYGYLKDPDNHNRLLIDPAAAPIVQRIFSLFEHGAGKSKIAKLLNAEQVPCPSEYKRLMGERYHNGNRLGNTTYWTYTTVHRILQNEMYIGNMEQGRDLRLNMHGQAKRKKKTDWVIVEKTHDPIISTEQWRRVQLLLAMNARTPQFEANVSAFAGYLKCGDCGRSMSKTVRSGKTFYTCGSYKRYGATACTKHYISANTLEKIVLDDLNEMIADVENLQVLVMQTERDAAKADHTHGERERLHAALERVQRMKRGVYEDYRENVISKADFMRYRQDYEAQEQTLLTQLERLGDIAACKKTSQMSWGQELAAHGCLRVLDRLTVAEAVEQIRVFEGGTIEITYHFSKS